MKKLAAEFDETQLDKLSGHEVGGKTLLEVLVEDFFINGSDTVQSLAEALHQGDYEKAKQYAHALRSPSLTLGLTGFAQFCAGLEEESIGLEAEAKLKAQYDRACHWLSRQTRSIKAS